MDNDLKELVLGLLVLGGRDEEPHDFLKVVVEVRKERLTEGVGGEAHDVFVFDMPECSECDDKQRGQHKDLEEQLVFLDGAFCEHP